MAARLKEELAVLQQESEEEQRTCRREVMRLRDQLRQACEEREEARGEVQKLGEALEATTASKVDMALAAEELKMVKVQMSEKLLEMNEQMSLESARSFEAMKSHSKLLQRVEETERVVDMERRQAQLVQADCHALRSEGQSGRQRLQEEQEKARRLEDHCRQLKEQTEVKDSLVSELKSELKSVQLAFQKQQKENNKMLKESRELRTAAEKVQALNDQLESQCCELSSALHSLTVENARLQSDHQASLKAEKSRVFKQLQEQDLLLEAARRNIQAELQRALSEKVSLQMELEKLKADHGQLLQTSTVAQETAATQKELTDRTIERLRGELITAKREQETVRKNQDGSKNELSMVVTELEGERCVLQSQLSEAKREARSLSSALQRQEGENRKLRGKMAAVEQQQCAGQQLDQMLKELSDSKNKLAYEKGKLQTRMKELQAQLEALRETKAASPLQRNRDELRKYCEDSSRANRELRERVSRLEKQVSNQMARIREQKSQLRQQHLESRATTGSATTQRIKDMETELKSLEALKNVYQRKNYEQGQLIQQFRTESQSLQRELQGLSSSLEGPLGDERELRHILQDNCQKLEASIRKLQEEKLRGATTENQLITADLEEAHSPRFKSKFDGQREGKWSPGEDLSDNTDCSPGGSKDGAPTSFKDDTEKLEASIRKLQEEKLRGATTENQLITADLEEAHSPRFKSKFDGQREGKWSPGEDLSDNTDCSPGGSKDGAPTSFKDDTEAPSRGERTEPEWERSTIQRWKTKNELARCSGISLSNL